MEIESDNLKNKTNIVKLKRFSLIKSIKNVFIFTVLYNFSNKVTKRCNKTKKKEKKSNSFNFFELIHRLTFKFISEKLFLNLFNSSTYFNLKLRK